MTIPTRTRIYAEMTDEERKHLTPEDMKTLRKENEERILAELGKSSAPVRMIHIRHKKEE